MTATDFDQDAATEIVAGFGNRPEMLVQILHRYMERFGAITDPAVRHLAEQLNMSRADVHGVVSFYHDFRTTPAARNVVKICAAEACQAMGSRQLAAHASKALGVAMEQSNATVTLEPIYCLGNCACSPAIMVNGKTYGRVSEKRFDEIIAGLEGASS